MYHCALRFPNYFVEKNIIANDIGKIDAYKFQMWKKWQGRTPILSQELHDILDRLNCTLFFAELFYTPPYGTLEWHVDSNTISDYIKINFVWGSPKHVMQWGQPLVDIDKKVSYTTAGTEYLKFEEDEVGIMAETKIIQPTIVNVGIPHRVKNFSNLGRWCLSLVLHQNNNRIIFPRALEIFNEYVQDLPEPLPHF